MRLVEHDHALGRQFRGIAGKVIQEPVHVLHALPDGPAHDAGTGAAACGRIRFQRAAQHGDQRRVAGQECGARLRLGAEDDIQAAQRLSRARNAGDEDGDAILAGAGAPFDVMAIAPLTNIARLVSQQATRARIGALVIMGGAVGFITFAILMPLIQMNDFVG